MISRVVPHHVMPPWRDDAQPRVTVVMLQRAVLPHHLPQLPPSDSHALRHSRPLRGEILCDETGQLYERVGQYVRRLHHLVAGASGELLDVNPTATSSWTPPDEPAPRTSTKRTAQAEDEREDRKEHGEEDARPAVRVLLPPGTRRVLRFGDIRRLIHSQIAHPERLRDAHRLSCFVQVVEAVRAQPVAGLIPPHPSGEPSKAAIERLTPALAEVLGVAGLAQPPRERQTSIDQARAGERFALVQVAADPTAGLAPRSSPRSEGDAVGQAEPPRRTIPAACLRPWEFVRARQEAEYDAAAARSRGILSRAWDAIRRLFDRGSYRRWRALLVGRSIDEQLWTIRPPAAWLADRSVRAWVETTLARGGYDVASMTREWEIFWRRKNHVA